MPITNYKELLKKVKSHIEGLDRLLYGGFDLQSGLHVIAIRGGQDSERSLLGIQVLYGIAQSLGKLLSKDHRRDVSTSYYSTYLDEMFMNDMLLDTYISSCIAQLMVMYVNMPEEDRDNIADVMSRVFFNTGDINKEEAYAEIVRNRILNLVEHRADYLLGKETLYYSTRTNCLHFRSARRCEDRYSDSDSNNLVFERKYNSVKQIFLQADQREEIDADLNRLNEFFCAPFVNIDFVNDTLASIRAQINSDDASIKLIGIDIDESLYNNSQFTMLQEIIKEQREKVSSRQSSVVLLLNVSKNERVPLDYVDMLIDMTAEQQETFTFRYLSIVKSRKQSAILGRHQYKRRDKGIDVYPNILTYFEQRRYLQRALVYTHSNALRDTYQQYINSKQKQTNEKKGYKDYMDNREKNEEAYFDALYPNYDHGYSSVDILDMIMLSQTSPYRQVKGAKAILQPSGCSTAIIGNPNTFKRFLTFGSIFSSAKNQEHTLLLLLHKDDHTMRRRLACPARAGRDKGDKRCLSCYSYIHFMDISMGNITPDEFVYHLIQQLDTQYQDGARIRRIVIDDMQIVDYCFPMLVKRKMFLAALIAICKDRDINLYILCDKHCTLVHELRAVVDNIVCTDRDKEGRLVAYIERYVGYQDTPSKIYSCNVKKAQQLFDCYERIDDDDNSLSYFELNNKYIDSKSIPSMDQYWEDCH